MNWDYQERRNKPDRRENDRQGKYDRRRNRCVHCQLFEERQGADKGLGFCYHHKKEMAAYAFACSFFRPADNSPPGDEPEPQKR